MEIKILGGNGLHASETRAVKKMAESLRRSWFGYASLLVADDQGSMDIDALIFTHDRLLLVELKEWSGRLESSDGQWYINKRSRGKSPYEIKRVQALRISKLLKQELEHKLGYTPKVEAHVVLCGSASPVELATSERRYVHTLDEFLAISSTEGYSALVESSTGYTNLFDKHGKPRPNSEQCRDLLSKFFAGPRIRPKEFSSNNYVANPDPWFRHSRSLYAEFKGHHRETLNDIALMRRWDLSALGIGNATRDQWAKVVLREGRIFSHAKAQERGLEEYLLRPLIPLGNEDITEDVTELYELRRTFRRLDEHLAKIGAETELLAREDLVRAVLAPFAELHALGVAHRDIDLHNLWHASEQNSIVISGFAAAFHPERGTVSDLRDMLQGSSIRLPEDALREEGDILDPFKQDVFMLGALAYRILFPSDPLPKDADGIWQWKSPVVSLRIIDDALTRWFVSSLAWDTESRFANASEMLAAFNDVTRPSTDASDSASALEYWAAINEGDFVRIGWSQFHLYTSYPPEPGESIGVGPSISYRTIKGEVRALLKFWPQIFPSPTTDGINRRLATFRARVEDASKLGQLTPQVLDYGLLESGGLFVVTQYEEGVAWVDATSGMGPAERAEVALALVQSLIALHDRQISHGDLHPGNILIREVAEAGVRIAFIDLLDFGVATLPYNTEYGPKNPAVHDAFARDRFAAYTLVQELLGLDYNENLKDELARGLSQPAGSPVSLEPLLAVLEKVAEPARDEAPEHVDELEQIWIRCPRLTVDELHLESDEGSLYLQCRWDKTNSSQLVFYITAQNAVVTIFVEPEKRQIIDVRARLSLSLSDLVSASNRSMRVGNRVALRRSDVHEEDTAAALNWLMSLDIVLDLLEARFSKTEIQQDDDLAPEARAGTANIWRALMDTEHESLMEIELLEASEEDRDGRLHVPYQTRGGRAMDFASDDRVFVYETSDESAFAMLNIEETSLDILVLDPLRSYSRRRLNKGDTIRLESQQSKSSRDKRSRAMSRVLEGGAVIAKLADYFDPAKGAMVAEMSERPQEETIRSLYNVPGSKGLNEQQVHAFCSLIAQGPVGVLQGPPGTGKTTFVAAFIHFLFSQLGVRNVLLVGQSHTSVDAVAVKARTICAEKNFPLSVVRIGQERMLASEMLDTHSRAVQRQARHAFHREYEHRVDAFAGRMGIPSALMRDVAVMHRSLDGLLEARSRYAAAKRAESVDSIVDLDPSAVTAEQQYVEVTELATRIIAKRFPDLDVEVDVLSAADPWAEVINATAAEHGFNNPAALLRLKALLSTSQEWLGVLHAGEANYDQFLVKTRQLVCGTLVGMGQKNLGVAEAEFDWVIVDEAARAQAGELVIPMQSAKRILLVGDHRQLPPMYDRAHVTAAAKRIKVDEKAIRITDFERAFESTSGVTLDTQYRMVKSIGDLVSSSFYADSGVKLRTGRGDAPKWLRGMPYPWNEDVVWIDSTSGTARTAEEEPQTGKFINRYEVNLILALLSRLLSDGGLKNIIQLGGGNGHHPIGVIAMYRAQKELIERELSKAEWAAPLRGLIRVDTVDSYQGQENSVVIVSLVRDNDSEVQGFMWESSRVNVAISRARERLVIIGAAPMWSNRNSSGPLGRVLTFIRSAADSGRGGYAFVPGILVEWSPQSRAEEVAGA